MSCGTKTSYIAKFSTFWHQIFIQCDIFYLLELGKLFLKHNIGLVYGAGDKGMMGEIGNAVSKGGGKVTGIIPRFILEGGISGIGPGKIIIIDSMHQRKQFMCDNVSVILRHFYLPFIEYSFQ